MGDENERKGNGKWKLKNRRIAVLAVDFSNGERAGYGSVASL